jgi:hypothetical protein
MSKIDTAGTYRGEIVESGIGLTKKNDRNGGEFPQAILRLKAWEKWIDDQVGMEACKLTEPGWVDWSSFGEDIISYWVLFRSKDEFSEDTKLLNYEQMKIATGWDGTEFGSFGNGSLVGKKVLFRVENDEYNGKTQLQASWLDAIDAPPQRELKSLDAASIATLNAKLRITKVTKPVAPAKPAAPAKPPTSGSGVQEKMAKAQAAAKPADPTHGAVASKPTTATPVAAATGSSTATPPAAPKRGPGRPRKDAAAPPPPPPPPAAPVVDEETDSSAGSPAECTQIEAWNYVNEKKGGNTDDAISEAWIAACAEVGGEKEESEFTPTDWASVQKIVERDLAL